MCVEAFEVGLNRLDIFETLNFLYVETYLSELSKKVGKSKLFTLK